jgi:hypothetical protein
MLQAVIDFISHRYRRGLPMVLVLVSLISVPAAWGAFGEETEKPEPVFTRQGDIITAKLIPRAKSTSVLINFKVAGGKLLDVQAMEFEKAERPEVDVKNYKSGFFLIHIGDVSPGGEAKISVWSDFFISSTAYYIHEKLSKPWVNAQAENISLPDRVQELVFSVKDGGPFDFDGAVNGQISVVGGPRDSFWGYALGTLFIRFFGIFIVLCMLMVGMILSGKIFQFLESKQAAAAAEKAPRVVPAEKDAESGGKEAEIDPATAAAVAVALHLHFSALQKPYCMDLSRPALTSWTLQGREQIMGDRFLTFNRSKR